jgi:hypothetical protein
VSGGKVSRLEDLQDVVAIGTPAEARLVLGVSTRVVSFRVEDRFVRAPGRGGRRRLK